MRRHPSALTAAELRPLLAGLMVAMFLAALDQTIVAIALPTIGRQFNDMSNLSWVVTAYLLSGTAVAPVFGTLERHLRPARHDRHCARHLRCRLGVVRACAEHADADPRPLPARDRRRRHHAGGADHHCGCDQSEGARGVSGLFQQRLARGRAQRTAARRRHHRISALVGDLLDQPAADGGRAGGAVAALASPAGASSPAQGGLCSAAHC